MNLVFFSHPSFIEHQSMPRFAKMLADGMKERGHQVDIWSPAPAFFNLPLPQATKKWLGYIDQFAVFPETVKRNLKKCAPDTLFIFTDHTLGPWVPLVKDRPNVIHSHDFIAQRSALGEIRESKTRWTGRQYQAYIRRGYSFGKNFIPISKQTRDDLKRFLAGKQISTELVYNGMNQSFTPNDVAQSRKRLGKKCGLDLTSGYVLHVGGNAWYKNRLGVMQIYDAWRRAGKQRLPLLLVGQKPDRLLQDQYSASPFKEDIHFLTDIDDELLRVAYNGATVFLFPSLAEGFGWPIAEAMASGCPVITTNEAPMTEVAGEAAFLVPRKQLDKVETWAMECAETLERVVTLSGDERKNVIAAGLKNVERFDPDLVLDKIEGIYKRIVENHRHS